MTDSKVNKNRGTIKVSEAIVLRLHAMALQERRETGRSPSFQDLVERSLDLLEHSTQSQRASVEEWATALLPPGIGSTVTYRMERLPVTLISKLRFLMLEGLRLIEEESGHTKGKDHPDTDENRPDTLEESARAIDLASARLDQPEARKAKHPKPAPKGGRHQ